MAKSTMQELGLKADEKVLVDYNQPVPEEFSPAPPPPYPGDYRFRLPKDVTASWAKREVEIVEGKGKVERVELVFDSADPLVIVNSPGGKTDDEPYQCRISNVERNRARKGDPPIYVSDMTYLLRALGSTAKPAKNAEFVAEMNKYGGREFVAAIEWSARCNKDRQVYVEVAGEDGSTSLSPGIAEDGSPVNGCGQAYYMNQWPRGEDGRYKERVTCACGNILRPFGNPRNFRATQKEAGK